jgi:hypothetical protein
MLISGGRLHYHSGDKKGKSGGFNDVDNLLKPGRDQVIKPL